MSSEMEHKRDEATGPCIFLLGSPRLWLPGGAVQALERKDAALLAVLALDGPTHRARAAHLLWPDLSDKQARSNLRQRLFRLRHSARREVVDSTGLLRLLDDITLDLSDVHRRLTEDAAAGQGELLGGHDYSDNDLLSQWVQQARERWRSTRLNLLAQVASSLESNQQIAEALRYAERMVGEDPLLEHAYRRLMRLHYLRGDRAAALAAFQKCRATLSSELEVTPNRETLQFARLIESSGALPQAAPAPRPTAALRPPRLVGRDVQWRELERIEHEARVGLVEGEAGIGKSRLIGDFVRANGDAPVFGARPGDAQVPYALLARIVRGLAQGFGTPQVEWVRRELARIAPELGPAADGKLESLSLQQAALQACDQWTANGLPLLAIDDLQFADAASLEVLPALLTGPKVRLASVLGVRGDQLPPAFASWAAAAEEDGTLVRVPLPPLDLPAVRDLLESLSIDGLDASRWAEPLARHAGGNPLFILETLIALLERDDAALRNVPPDLPAPQHVGALIERRLAQLSAPALKLARLAALAGQDFSVELAAAVLGQHVLDIADHWRELESAQVIRDAGFAHDLIFEATLRSVPSAVARALHRDLARQLQARRAAPARVAAHWDQAGEAAEAGAAYEEAAQAAGSASRDADEADLWQRAAECHERAADRRRAFAARCAGVKALMVARPLEHARALTDQLLAQAQGDAERLEALLERATLLLVQQDAAAHDTANEALALARRVGRPWLEFEAARRVAVALAQRKQGMAGVELLQPFEERVQADGSPRQRYEYWSDMGYVLNDAGRRRAAERAWRRAAENAQTLGDRHEAVTCTTNLAIMLLQLGHPEQAYEQAERARRLQVELGHRDDVVAAVADMNVASSGLLLGYYDQALELFASALERFRSGSATTWAAGCENNLASAWLQIGQVARAQQTLRPLDAAVPPTTRARRHVVEGRIGRALGRSAMPHLCDALALLGERGDPFQRVLAQLDEARELEPVAALDQCRRCRARAGEFEMLGAEMKARLLEIESLLRCADGDAAAERAVETQALLAECRPVDMHWAEALWLLVRAFDAAGDEARALRMLDEAARWLRREALPRVPGPFRDAFVHRQPVNRALLAMAQRRLRT